MNPVLLLHGALGSADQFVELKSLLESSGRAVFAMNFSGHGGKPFASEFGIAQFADEVVHFITENKLQQVDVFGYSMGGYVSLYASLVKPELFGRIVTLGTKFDWTKSSADMEVKKLNPDKIQEKVPAFAASLSSRHAPLDWKQVVNQTAAMMLDLGDHPLLHEKNLSEIKQKVVIALGSEDGMTSPDFSERVSREIPKGKFVLLPDTPHPIEKVKPEIMKQLLGYLL